MERCGEHSGGEDAHQKKIKEPLIEIGERGVRYCQEEKEGLKRDFHSILGENDVSLKFFSAFLKNIMALEQRIKMSEEKLFAGGLPGDFPGQKGGEMSFFPSFFREGAFQDKKVGIPAEFHDIFAVVGIARISQHPAFGFHPEADAGGGVDHRENLQFQVGKRDSPFFGFQDFQRVSLGIDPMAVNSAELIIEFSESRRADEVKGKRAGEIRGVIAGEEERDKVGNVIGMKV
jgi:hypothetical protein